MRISTIDYNPNFIGTKNPKYISPEELLAFTVKKDTMNGYKSIGNSDSIIKQIPMRIKLKHRLSLHKHETTVKKESK